MADQPFDPHVTALFAEAPPFGDDEAFAIRVERGLARQARQRTLVIGAAGLIGAGGALAAVPWLSDQAGVLTGGLDRWSAWLAQPQAPLWALAALIVAGVVGALAVEEA